MLFSFYTLRPLPFKQEARALRGFNSIRPVNMPIRVGFLIGKARLVGEFRMHWMHDVLPMIWRTPTWWKMQSTWEMRHFWRTCLTSSLTPTCCMICFCVIYQCFNFDQFGLESLEHHTYFPGTVPRYRVDPESKARCWLLSRFWTNWFHGIYACVRRNTWRIAKRAPKGLHMPMCPSRKSISSAFCKWIVNVHQYIYDVVTWELFRFVCPGCNSLVHAQAPRRHRGLQWSIGSNCSIHFSWFFCMLQIGATAQEFVFNTDGIQLQLWTSSFEICLHCMVLELWIFSKKNIKPSEVYSLWGFFVKEGSACFRCLRGFATLLLRLGQTLPTQSTH